MNNSDCKMLRARCGRYLGLTESELASVNIDELTDVVVNLEAARSEIGMSVDEWLETPNGGIAGDAPKKLVAQNRVGELLALLQKGDAAS